MSEPLIIATATGFDEKSPVIAMPYGFLVNKHLEEAGRTKVPIVAIFTLNPHSAAATASADYWENLHYAVVVVSPLWTKIEAFNAIKACDILVVEDAPPQMLMCWIEATAVPHIIMQHIREGKPYIGIGAGAEILGCPGLRLIKASIIKGNMPEDTLRKALEAQTEQPIIALTIRGLDHDLLRLT